MDRARNPFTPNAGAPPPLLSGRDSLLEDFEVLLSRVGRGLTDKGMIVTGLRGVGKTVLLNAFEARAVSRGHIVIKVEASKEAGSFTAKFPALARKALIAMSPADRWKDRAVRAAGVLRGFKAQFDPDGRWALAYDGPDVTGVADTGDFVSDLPELMIVLGEAAQQHEQVVVFLIDEIQFLARDELSALVMAKHQINQAALPIALAGAGLPQVPSLTIDAQTYAERMFTWPEIGSLGAEDARQAIAQPIAEAGFSIDDAALDYIVQDTQGYPFFLQEFGKAVWDAAHEPRATLDDAITAMSAVEAILDQDFFAPRLGGLTDLDLEYVRALASLGPGEHAPQEVAKAMGRTSSSQISSTAKRLVDRGVVYNSKRGRVAFTVPQLERYAVRAL